MINIKILIADNEVEQISLYKKHFDELNKSQDAKYNFILNFVEDGEKAYQSILKDNFDFAIFEEYLPNKKASEIMTALTALNENKIRINSVIITNNGSENLVLLALRLGFKNYWRKKDFKFNCLVDEILKSYNERLKICSTVITNDETQTKEKKNNYAFLNFLFENSSKFDNSFTREKLDDYYNGIRDFVERKVKEYNGEMRVKKANNFLILFDSSDDSIETPVLCAIEIFAGLSMFNLSISETSHKLNYKIGLHYGEIASNSEEMLVSEDLNFSVHMLQTVIGYHFIISDSVYNKLINKLKHRFSEASEFDNHKIYHINY